ILPVADFMPVDLEHVAERQPGVFARHFHEKEIRFQLAAPTLGRPLILRLRHTELRVVLLGDDAREDPLEPDYVLAGAREQLVDRRRGCLRRSGKEAEYRERERM